jgi:DNA-binding XRE family transcriptional regulator
VKKRRTTVAAELFIEARLIAGLSVSQAAEILGITPKTVQNWEAGKTFRRVPTLTSSGIAAATPCPIRHGKAGPSTAGLCDHPRTAASYPASSQSCGSCLKGPSRGIAGRPGQRNRVTLSSSAWIRRPMEDRSNSAKRHEKKARLNYAAAFTAAYPAASVTSEKKEAPIKGTPPVQAARVS